MAEPIDQLGLDIKPFKKSVDEANRANESLAQSSDKAGAAIARTEKTANGSRFFNIAAVAGLLYKLGDAITGLGDRAKSAIDNFQAGGARRDAQMGNRGDAALSTGVSPIIQDATAGFQNKIASFILGGLSKVAQGLNKVFKIDGLDDYVKGVEAVREEGEKELKVREKIAEEEDVLADMARVQTAEKDSQIGLLNQQIKIQEKQLELANLATVEGRAQANQAKTQIRALELQIEAINFQREQISRHAKAETAEIRLQQEGMKNVGAMVKLEAEYQSKILQAKRDGNSELMTELALQLQLKQAQLKVVEHNLTPRDLLNERKAARKFDRDLRHQEARERDMMDRAARGAFGQTKGSRFDRFRQQQAARAAAVPQNMTVNEMVVSTMKVNIPR